MNVKYNIELILHCYLLNCRFTYLLTYLLNVSCRRVHCAEVSDETE